MRHRPIADSEVQRVVNSVGQEIRFYLDQKPADFFRKRWRDPETGEPVKTRDATEVSTMLRAMGEGAASAAHAGNMEDADPACEAAYAVFLNVPDDFEGEVRAGEVVAMPPSEFAWWERYGWVRRARGDEIPGPEPMARSEPVSRLRRRLCMLCLSRTGR